MRQVKSKPPDDALLTRYLLGELPADECRRIEQDCLDDDQLFERLEAIEAEVTDDYVRGVLAGPQRRQFEQRVLTRAQRPKLQLAELITGYGRPQWSLLLRVSAMAASLALALGLGWFFLKRSSPQPAQPRVSRSIQPVAPSPPPQPAASLPAAVPSPAIATFLLTPGGVRGDGHANEISLPAGATQVRFRMDLPVNEYKTYEASLNRVEGESLFVQKGVKPRAAKNGVTLFVVIPAGTLPTGASILTLRGVAETGGPPVLAKYVIQRGAQNLPTRSPASTLPKTHSAR